MNLPPLFQNMLTALAFAFLGMAVLGIGFYIIEKITPRVHIWNELIEKQNTALAIVLGSALLGIALIVSAAVHG